MDREQTSRPWRSLRATSMLPKVRSLASLLRSPRDLDSVVESVRGKDLVCIGEAAHGTHEFYEWRARLTRRFIEESEATWIGVEGDWPDCWRINRWVRGQAGAGLDARGILARLER